MLRKEKTISIKCSVAQRREGGIMWAGILVKTPLTIQYNTIQYNTIQYNTIQYNTIQYNA